MGTHRFDPGLRIRCGINSCIEQYKNFESFRSHVYRKHRDVLVIHSASAEPLTIGSLDQQHGEMDGECWEKDVEVELRTCNYDLKRSAALFLLKTRQERKVTQTALNGIVQDFQSLWRDAMEKLQVWQYY